MFKYIGRRTLQNILVFVVFLSATFFLLQAQPGDISQQFLANPKITPEVREQFREQLGLTGSVWSQYVTYMKNFFTGNLGISFSEYPREVTSIIGERLRGRLPSSSSPPCCRSGWASSRARSSPGAAGRRSNR